MEKQITWGNESKELNITAWKNLHHWAIPFGLRFSYTNGETINAALLKWTVEIAIDFLCFGIAFELFSWRKDNE